MSKDIFEDFMWHSSIGIDVALNGNKQFVTRLPNNKKARSMFTASSDNMLIHKTTKALWKITDDKSSIEPVFATDILTEDDCSEFMEDNQ
jgi:hypothetical protein